MTDAPIIAVLATRDPLPNVYVVISEFRISYQQARRCWEAAGGAEGDGGTEPVKKVHPVGGQKPALTMEDF